MLSIVAAVSVFALVAVVGVAYLVAELLDEHRARREVEKFVRESQELRGW